MTRTTSIVLAALLALSTVTAAVALATHLGEGHAHGGVRDGYNPMMPETRGMPGSGDEQGPYGEPRGPWGFGAQERGEGGSVLVTVCLSVALAAVVAGLALLLVKQRPWRREPRAVEAGAAVGPGGPGAPDAPLTHEAQTEPLPVAGTEDAVTAALAPPASAEAGSAGDAAQDVPGDSPADAPEQQGERTDTGTS
jgi:hypothetical protein